MKNDFVKFTVGLRPIIRYLGLSLGAVIGLPFVIGFLVFLLNPSEMALNPGGAAFAFVAGLSAIAASHRWMTIGGVATNSSILMRGWFSTVRLKSDQLANIQRVESSFYDTERGSTRRDWHYELFNYKNDSIGKIPSMLHACQDFDKFLARLRKIAAQFPRSEAEPQ